MFFDKPCYRPNLDLLIPFRVFFRMEPSSRTAAAAVIFVLTLVINVFLGYMRQSSRKFSFRWFLYIHLSIPFVIAARLATQLDYRFIPLFVLAALVGQVIGGRLEL